jgi:hypothetical protein
LKTPLLLLITPQSSLPQNRLLSFTSAIITKKIRVPKTQFRKAKNVFHKTTVMPLIITDTFGKKYSGLTKN